MHRGINIDFYYWSIIHKLYSLYIITLHDTNFIELVACKVNNK